MTTAALTPQERQALNAWIAEHVYGGTWDDNATLSCFADYAGDWTYAGPLFERYIGWIIQNDGTWDTGYFDSLGDWISLAQGTTGPEAIAKAVKVWEEAKR